MKDFESAFYYQSGYILGVINRTKATYYPGQVVEILAEAEAEIKRLKELMDSVKASEQVLNQPKYQPPVRRSPIIGRGIYQFEWLDDRIAVTQWGVAPKSTSQWVEISSVNPEYFQFYLEGSCNEDINVVGLTKDDLEKLSKPYNSLTELSSEEKAKEICDE